MSPWEYALLAQEAYTAAPDIGQEASASRAIVREVDDGLVVAFPGTDNLPCVGADIDVQVVNIPGVGNVFKGFWGAWNAIAADVLKIVDGRPVIFVGHSLGAAIALMAAADFASLGSVVLAVWGFEPPRVVAGVGLNLGGAPLHLYWNGGDVVPLLPSWGKHPAPLITIGKPTLLPNARDHDIARVIESLEPSCP